MAKKKKNFKCPECGEEFDSERGMKIHESRSHSKKSSGKKDSRSKSKKEQEENVIHIKFNRPEAVESKKDLLFAQRELLEILKHVKKYHLLRKRELILKTKAKKKIQEVSKDVNHLKKDLPKPKIPKILEEGKEEEKKEKEEKEGKVDHSNINKELDEIQEKLAKLEQSTQVSQ